MADELINADPDERIRVNVKANSKGEYACDATFEDTALSVDIDTATTKVVEAIELLERKCTEKGLKLAGK